MLQFSICTYFVNVIVLCKSFNQCHSSLYKCSQMLAIYIFTFLYARLKKWDVLWEHVRTGGGRRHPEHLSAQ